MCCVLGGWSGRASIVARAFAVAAEHIIVAMLLPCAPVEEPIGLAKTCINWDVAAVEVV